MKSMGGNLFFQKCEKFWDQEQKSKTFRVVDQRIGGRIWSPPTFEVFIPWSKLSFFNLFQGKGYFLVL